MSDRAARGIGPGPVFLYEWIIAARRWQAYALRALFVLGLLAAVLTIGLSRAAEDASGPQLSLRLLAELGENLFVAVVGTQLALVLLAAPAATAGAICLDRARGTLAHVLVTDLDDREIVLGKLAARLTPVLVMIAATLPVMELLTLLGGVDPDALVGAFVVSSCVTVLGCSLALVFSIWVRKTHEAVLATYAIWGLWLLGAPMFDQISRAIGLHPDIPVTLADPFQLAFAPYWRPGSTGWQDYLIFAAQTLGISAVLALFAVRTTRRVSTRDVVPRARRRARQAAAASESPDARPPRWHRTPRVILAFNPVLWREWHRSRTSRWGRIVAIVFIAITLVFSVMAVFSGPHSSLSPWVNALQVSSGLLMLSVIAATSLAEERVRGSLDVLLTTPMRTGAIVMGKWLGTFRLVPPLAILPSVVVLGHSNLELKLRTAIAMAAFVLCAGAAITSLGLAMATWCPRLGRAVGLTVSLYLVATVGWVFAIGAIGGTSEAERLMMASPFWWSGAVTDDASHGNGTRFFGAAVFWTVSYALLALGLLAATLATFDRCLGRISDRGSGRVRRGSATERDDSLGTAG